MSWTRQELCKSAFAVRIFGTHEARFANVALIAVGDPMDHEMEEWWPIAPSRAQLAHDEVHLHRICLDQPDERVRALAAVLSTDEYERAERFRFARDQRRYIVGRACLRLLLAHYLEGERGDPHSITLQYGSHGKPELVGPLSVTSLKFNLAHSDQLALVALTLDHALGVDLERIRPLAALDQVAERYFAPEEAAALRDLPMPARQVAFFRCWTLKEAYLKGRGVGLSVELHSLAEPIEMVYPTGLVRDVGRAGEVAWWHLRSMVPFPGYIAALAVDAAPQRLLAHLSTARQNISTHLQARI
jgi:4'-phosphopantetheinyl transferase